MGCCYRIYFCALKLYFIPLIGHLAFCVLGFSDAALCLNERRIKGLSWSNNIPIMVMRSVDNAIMCD